MKAVLTAWRELAPGIRLFDFTVPEVDRLPFLPGQFVSMKESIGGREITRAYSICTAPDGNRFSLCLNIVREGAFSPFLFSLDPGASVEMQGPLGAFTLRDPARERIWVAIGTGIAPFRSMAWAEFPRSGAPSVTLIYGARCVANLLYREEWERWAREQPLFQFQPVLSRPGPGWAGRQGHVQPHVVEALAGRKDLDVYVCGLKAMVDDVRARLRELGLDRKRIIHEKYD